MFRSEIWWVNFEPSVGGEIKKIRPAVIISNNQSNKYLNRVQVIPISTQIAKIYPCEALIEIDGIMNKAMTDQIMTVSKKRLGKKIGAISCEDMKKIEIALLVQLGI